MNQTNTQINLSAYDTMAICDNLLDTFLWLEKYIEIAYGDDWNKKKQLDGSKITRPDIASFDANRVQTVLGTQLRLLRITIKKELPMPDEDKLKWLQEQLEPQLHKWIDKSGINVNNCSLELAKLLISICQVLRNEKKIDFLNKLSETTRANVDRMNDEEFVRAAGEVISYQNFLDDEDKKAESLQDKYYNDDIVTDKFNFLTGNANRGQMILDQIEKSYKNYLQQQNTNDVEMNLQ